MRAFLDIETSGLDPFEHEIIEVAYLLERADVLGARTVQFSLLFDHSKAETMALEVNGWGTREFAPLIKDHREAAAKLAFDLKDAIIVGNAVHFDTEFITHFIRRYAPALDSRPWDHRLVDLKSLAAGRIRIDPAELNSDAIGRHFGVPLPRDAHSALADARWNRELYHAMGLFHK